ncbi:MAG: phosphoenolpyruvate carboxykinase (ATP), partial [Candidatus Limnocylindrales bacterium]
MTTTQSTVDQARIGAAGGPHVHHNLSVPILYEAAIRRDEGVIAAGGPLVVMTGKHTGRSPKDKFVVDEPASHDKVWWGEINQPIDEAHYERLREKVIGHLAAHESFVKDAYVGADPFHRRSVRVTTETAWASLFAHNLFIRPSADELAAFEPDFTIYDAPSLQADPATDGTRS